MANHELPDLLIRNAQVAGQDNKVDILIHDGRIASIVDSGVASARQVIDACGGIVTPGLVEPHIHMDKALTADRVPRGLTGDLRTREGLETAIRVTQDIKAAFTEDDVRDRAIRVARMASRSGVTAVRTHVDVDPIVGLTSIRGLLAARQACAGIVDIQIVAFPQEGIFRAPGTERLLRQALELGADVVGGAPSLDDQPGEHVRYVFELAREFGVPVDMHVDESDRREDFTLPLVIEEARKGDVPSVSVAHISSLTHQPDDVARKTIANLVESGIYVVVNPIIVKITRLRELLKAGVPVVFGSDNVRDPFYPLGTASPLASGMLACQIAALGSHEDLRLVFGAVTAGSARMLGLTGRDRIEVGATADLAVFASSTPEEVILDQRSPLAVIKAGRLVNSSHYTEHAS